MSYRIADFGPSDLLDDDREDVRRIKTSSILTDNSGSQVRASLAQELVTGDRTDFINVQFQYNLPVNEDSADIRGTATGTGQLDHGLAMAQVKTGTGIGTANVVSKDSIRYFPGHEFAAEMTAFAIDPAPGTRAIWGIGDAGGVGDALLFGYLDGVFGVVLRSSGVETFVPQSEFNGEPAPELNPMNLNLWTFRVDGMVFCP